MKRTFLTLGLAAALLGGAALLLGGASSRAQAQQPSTGTRVAIVNVGFVFSKYEKSKFLKAELENTLAPFKKEGEKIKADMTQYADYLKKNPNLEPAKAEPYQKHLLKLKRDLEDLDLQARNKIGKRQEEQVVLLYQEVTKAIEGYAKANGIHLVLGYGEQVEGDAFSFANINRKMQGMDLGSATPLFQIPGIDISQGVTETLNRSYQPQAGGAATPVVPVSLPKQ